MRGGNPLRYGDVTDLTAGAVDTMNDLSADDDAAAYAGAEGGQNHVLTAAAAALPRFAQSCHVGIVAGFHGKPGKPAKDLGDIDNAPAQIAAFVHVSVIIHRAGNTDADADKVVLRNIFPAGVAKNGCSNIRKDPAALIRCICGDLPFEKQVAFLIKTGDLNGGSA